MKQSNVSGITGSKYFVEYNVLEQWCFLVFLGVLTVKRILISYLAEFEAGFLFV